MAKPHWVSGLFVVLGLCSMPSAVAAQGCDPTGRWAFKIEWSGGDCADLPDDDGILIIVQGDDGQIRLADSEDGAGALDRRVNVRIEEGACRIKLDFNVNQTAYGAPDLARWTYSLLDRDGVVQGSGTYSHDERGRKGKRCTQRFSASGARAARSQTPSPMVTPPGTTSASISAAPGRPGQPGAATPGGGSAASPGGCDEGRSVTSDTSGRCCWSGQAWAGLRSRCVGIPTSCPEGRHVEGEECAGGSEAERLSMMLTRELGTRRGAVEECWRKTFPDGVGPKGFLRVQLSVRRSGQVREAKVIQDTLGQSAVNLCVIEMISGWTLPATGADEVIFEYPFLFGPPTPPAKK